MRDGLDGVHATPTPTRIAFDFDANAKPLTISVLCINFNRRSFANLFLLSEFKEIRKEWKARKKEEENQRKAEEERQRASVGANQTDGQPADPVQTPTSQNYPPGVRPQLPPIGYAPAAGQVAAQYPGGVDQLYQQGNGYSAYPHSPYGQNQQMYPQRHTP